jgi:hypothetical protein
MSGVRLFTIEVVLNLNVHYYICYHEYRGSDL